VALALFAAPALAVASSLASPGRRLRAVWALTMLAAAFLNQFAMVGWLAGGYVILLAGGWGELKRRPLGPALIGVAALLVYWWTYLILHPAALVTPWGGSPSTLDILFGYPPTGERVVYWFARGWPVMTAVCSVTLAILLVRFARDRRQRASLFAAAVILFPLLGVTMISDVYNESRYHFHLYPFLTVVFALALNSITRFLVAGVDTLAALAGKGFRARPLAEIGIIAALAFLMSPDVAPGEIGSFLKRDYTTPKDPVRSILNWRPYAFFHQDHVGPAKVVRDAIQPDDLVFVAGPTYWLSIYVFYIGRVDYAVPGKVGERVVHHVTGVPCLGTPEELDQTLAQERGRRVWILGDLNLLGDESHYFSPEMKARLREVAVPRVYLGRDLNTFVARLDPDRLPP
jgi:hypothetical protein